MSDYEIKNRNTSLNLMSSRLGLFGGPKPAPVAGDGVADEAALHGLDHTETMLKYNGGIAQQDRMILDKRRSLDRALKYSYQGATIKKVDDSAVPWDGFQTVGASQNKTIRALINPNKLKQDYDDKIVSVPWEHGFKTGDVFEWEGTGTHWLIYLQDLTELAYFRGDIRRCAYKLKWKDEDGIIRETYAATRGPVETKINFIQKNGISVDQPNHSLNILMPKNDFTLSYFKRYSKFYLQASHEEFPEEYRVCWRVEATDWVSMPGVFEITAVEYYSNDDEDDLESGVVGALIVEPEDSNEEAVNILIDGPSFIRPFAKNTYVYKGINHGNKWSVSSKLPVTLSVSQDGKTATVVWNSGFHGQFELTYANFTKQIVVETL